MSHQRFLESQKKKGTSVGHRACLECGDARFYAPDNLTTREVFFLSAVLKGNVSFAQEKFLSKNRAQVFTHPPAPFPEAGKREIGEIGRPNGLAPIRRPISPRPLGMEVVQIS
jgi:hypothetical protein